MTDEKAREVLGDVSAYLASRASLENEMLAGHTFTDICNAIKALKQTELNSSYNSVKPELEPCEDCISREEVLDEINRIGTRAFKTYNNYSELFDFVDSLPPVTQKAEWIPCSERLPEVNGRYVVTRGLNACGALWNRIYIINYSDLMGGKSERIWWEGNVGKSDFKRIDDVIAWMPLPDVYKESEE